MTNLLVGDFIDFIFLKSFVVGIDIPFLPATFADKASRHYHSTNLLYDLSFPFSLFCRCFVSPFWPTLAIYLSWVGKYYLLLITYILDGSVPFFRLLFRILTSFTRLRLVLKYFYL